MKPLVDLLHLLLCDRPHTYTIEDIVLRNKLDNTCFFYVENDIADGYDMEDHLKWREILEKFKQDLDLHTDKDTLNFIKESISLSQTYRNLIQDNPERSTFVKSLF